MKRESHIDPCAMRALSKFFGVARTAPSEEVVRRNLGGSRTRHKEVHGPGKNRANAGTRSGLEVRRHPSSEEANEQRQGGRSHPRFGRSQTDEMMCERSRDAAEAIGLQPKDRWFTILIYKLTTGVVSYG